MLNPNDYRFTQFAAMTDRIIKGSEEEKQLLQELAKFLR